MAQPACSETEPDQIRVSRKDAKFHNDAKIGAICVFAELCVFARNAYLIFLETPNATCLSLRGQVTTTENLRQLLRRNNFELGVRTVAWLFIRAPPSKLRCVTEAAARS